MRFTPALVATVLLESVAAHPGHSLAEELQERRQYLSTAKVRDLSHCTAKLKARGVEARNLARREQTFAAARAKRGLTTKRSLTSVLATDHNATDLGYSLSTDETTVFASANTSCVLTPDVTQGPYYVGGEYIRSNIIETQTGVDTVVDYQVIDSTTCEPVPNVYVEMWHANATGVYSGIVESGNGNTADTENIDKTFLRGIQETDEDGVAQFETIFPGHYVSRANHFHILVHTNVTVYANGTLGNDVSASHVGQGFFDQTLVSAVEALAPYNTNTQDLTVNADDSILAQEAETEGVDPIFEYTYLGDTLSDGLLAWLAFGIDTSESSSVTPAAFYYATGGEANSDSSSGGGGPP
ncbi:Intradiol ring-cleavage dioxygenase [Coniella lustricola]|uniref:Intradiol ring-cleavage dioxygenase n=1 Tax=Coniella lustricola TaxID=2025994 RepID=A0A2T3ANN5_9PEZI|nr:Intradiol ring-cleavage dioxygenase [Coniella lustricola]